MRQQYCIRHGVEHQLFSATYQQVQYSGDEPVEGVAKKIFSRYRSASRGVFEREKEVLCY
jgi:hypothetical protein